MKYSHGNRIHIKVFLFVLVIFFSSLNGFAEEKQGPQDTVVKTKAGKERLVARGIGKGGQIYLLRWCGNNGLVYRLVDTHDAEMLDFQTGKRTPINVGPSDTLLNCSPDGKKLFYLSYESSRLDEKIEEPTVELVPGVFGWLGGTEDIYMYDTVTGEKTIVASIRRAGSYDAVSRDGTKILLGGRHRLASKKGAPELEGVWFAEKWTATSTTWFPDSSGVITFGEHTGIICIEIFGEHGWAKCFEIETDTNAPMVDKENKVYFLFIERDPERMRMHDLGGEYYDYDPGKNFLHRCEIRKKELSCERIIKEPSVMPTYGFLPDGDIVFDTYVDDNDDKCIRRITPGQKTSRCEIYPRYGDSVYRSVSLRGVSPDGRWLVFSRSNWTGWKKRADGMGTDLWQGQNDLFVIDLLEE